MKKITSIALACTVALSAVSATVFAADTQSPEAKYLVEQGYLKGSDNGMELEREATNAEALTMLYRITGKEIPASAENEHWAQGILNDATELGYIVAPNAQTTKLYGTLEVTENEVLLKGAEENELYALNTDEALTTIFVGDKSYALAEKLQELNGKEVVAVVSRAMTRSLPPQTFCYYLLEATENSNPIYMEISEVSQEDGTVTAYSADGQYAIHIAADTNLSPLKTKNIIKAVDLEVGDKILAYSNIMTMSIPAWLNPESVIVLEKAVNEFVPDENIETTSFLNLISNMLPEKDVTAFEADGYLTRDAMAKICYALLK